MVYDLFLALSFEVSFCCSSHDYHPSFFFLPVTRLSIFAAGCTTFIPKSNLTDTAVLRS